MRQCTQLRYKDLFGTMLQKVAKMGAIIACTFFFKAENNDISIGRFGCGASLNVSAIIYNKAKLFLYLTNFYTNSMYMI